ncbi:MAG: hypothetical protein IPL39_05385 [Opitutaceae bacterium]|nr:hypothetical protein [Opitutaceae bacterium]
MRLLPAIVGDLRTVLLCGLLFAVGSLGRAAKWDLVPAADLAAKESTAFPGADAEILLAEQTQRLIGGLMAFPSAGGGIQGPGSMATGGHGTFMNPGDGRAVLENFVRLKIYTANGAREQRTVYVEQVGTAAPDGELKVEAQENGTYLSDRCGLIEKAEARVLKPDGRITELVTGAVSLREGSTGDDRVARIDLPVLEPGDVVEYRWRREVSQSELRRMIPCQHPLPVREYRLFVGSLPDQARMLVMNCPKAETSQGSHSVEVVVRELPAFKPEPFMGGQWDHRGWIYPKWSYRRDGWFNADERWSAEFWEATDPSKAMKAKAGELIAGAATEEEKLRRLYEFCRNEFVNSDWVRTPKVQKKHEKQRDWRERTFGYKNGTVRAAWEDQVGDSEMVDLVFATLARGAGFSVRKTRSAERSFFDSMHEKLGHHFLNRCLVAVEVGGQWRFCSPGRRVIPYGMIAACDEDVPVLWSGLKKVESAKQTPVAAAALSQAQRKARLRLDAEGTLEGAVEETLTGHLAITLKQRFGREAEADAAELAATEWLCGEVKRRLPGVELSALSCANLRSVDLPVTVKYQMRVPGYAAKVEGTLQLPPSYFEAGDPAVFPTAERKYPISFPHAWSELDDIEIVLPAGFGVVDPSAPPPAGDATVLGVSYRMEYDKETRSLRYRREFAVGGNGAISFKVEAYPTLKKFFDHVHGADAHTIVLARVH